MKQSKSLLHACGPGCCTKVGVNRLGGAAVSWDQILAKEKRHTMCQEETLLCRPRKWNYRTNTVSRKEHSDTPGHSAPNWLTCIWVFPWWVWWVLSSGRRKAGLQTLDQVLQSVDLGILKRARMGCRSASGGSPSPSSIAVIPRDHVSHLESYVVSNCCSHAIT